MEQIIIIGLGNPLLCDEGAGIHVLDHLKQIKAFPEAALMDLGTSSYDLVNYIDPGIQKVIIIDSIQSTQVVPGEVVRLTVKDILSDNEWKLSLHQMKLIDSLKLISIEYDIPEILIIGISPFDTKTYSTSLSENLKTQFSSIIEMVVQYIHEFVDIKA